MRINNNISAMNTHTKLANAQGAQAKSLEKLSSGLRINRAGDDAAGLAISEKMRGQIGGLNQAVRNSQDGISLIQTAEGALNETHSILQRMRELAVQGSNDTNTVDDRKEIKGEMAQLSEEVTRIADKTAFNGQKLMGATEKFSGKFQIGANSGDTMDISINSMDAKSLNVHTAASVGTPVNAAVSEVSYVKGGGDEFLAAGVDLTKYTQSDNLDIKIEMLSEGTGTGTNAATKATAKITVNGKTSIITAEDDTATTPTFKLDRSNFEAFTTGQEIKITGAATPTTTDEANIKITGNTMTGPDGLDVSTTENAQLAIGKIDDAIGAVSTERSKLGAVQSRLDHTITNLTTTSENLSAAESRIRDVDMAKEMMNFTKNNILNQASTAMLAQANQMPQGVLQLLG